MLGRIELICNQSWVSDEVVLRARGQTIAFFGVVRQHQLIPKVRALLLNLCLMSGFRRDATASGRLSWLERGGRCFEPTRKVRGLSQNQVFV
ncbi:hypothetical protein ACFQHW_09095 [Lapidilactobacillus achengensis]|uniref:Transposase n=1 Tax=Lapidilactobacillus achengensis TaxID=2486000 RepID=A0ABW1UPS3_9LACO